MDIPDFAGLSHIADFRLKCCILKEDTKKIFQEGVLWKVGANNTYYSSI
jgi:hypothetical protein